MTTSPIGLVPIQKPKELSQDAWEVCVRHNAKMCRNLAENVLRIGGEGSQKEAEFWAKNAMIWDIVLELGEYPA